MALFGRSSIAVGDDGRFYVAPTYTSGEIAIFDRDGGYAGSLGRRGQGPGEFGRITKLIFDPVGQLHVFEGPRHTVWPIGAQRPSSVNILPLQPYGLMFRSDSALVIHYLPSGAGVATQFHQVDVTRGLISRTWGERRSPEPTRLGEHIRVI